jgi:GT2 family glycosyltransferase
MIRRNLDVSIIVLTYNSQHCISRCLDSIIGQDVLSQIVVIDNGSTDDTTRIVESSYPSARLIKHTDNVGYAVGNNLGVEEATHELVVIMNPDVVLMEGAVRELVEPIASGNRIMTTPLVLLPDCSTVNVSGLICNPLGFSFPNGLGLRISDVRELPLPSGISGCCFAFRKALFSQLGGFDERFFMYNEDVDLSWRAHLSNVGIVVVESARVIHDYRSGMSLFKLSQLEKNRYLILRKHMPIKWLLILLPSVIISDFVSLLAFSRFGFKGIRAKFEAWTGSAAFNSEKPQGDFKNLRKMLRPVFPSQPKLTNSKIEGIFRRSAEVAFKLNWRLVR